MAYVNLGTFFTDNNEADRLSEETIWIWDENKNGVNMGGYVSKTSGSDAAFEIAPSQGFFVSSGSAASNKVTFNVANQSHKTDSFLKNDSERVEIKLFISQNELVNSTRLYFAENASIGFDNGLDASMFTGVGYDLAIYSHLVAGDSQKKIETQFLPNSNYEDAIVPIGVKAVKGKEITISATALNLPKGINIFLEDRKNNTLTNLNEVDFSIVLEEDLDGVGRFFLRTSSKVLATNFSELSGVSIYENNQRLRVVGLQQAEGSVSIFNMLGKQVVLQKFTSSNTLDIMLPKLAAGVYIARLQTAKGTLSRKIILE